MIAVRLVMICLVSLPALLAGWPGEALGQSDPYGVLDTVMVESKITNPGSAFTIRISVRNDEPLSGITIPLKYPSVLVVYDSTSFLDSRMKQWSVLRITHNLQDASILLGGLAVGDPPMQPGSGAIAEIFFHAAANAQTGQSGVIDSAYVPPAGKFILSSYQSISIFPAFIAGNQLVGAQNEAPEFEPTSRKFFNEGGTVSFDVKASDPEGMTLHLYGGSLPPGAGFKDNGNGAGTLTWTIPYLGPGSASNSPYRATFVASDGNLAVQMDVPIEVINTNRPPQISIAGGVTAFSGDSVLVPLIATDPDLETITFSVSDLPTGAQLHSDNPGYIIWSSSIADSGTYSLHVTANDESGGTANKQIDLDLLPTLPIELSLPNEQAFNNEIVTLPINLHNRVEVAGMYLLIQYDPSLLTLISLQRDSIRTKLWYPFNAQITTDGKVFISARMVTGVPGSDPVAPGDGPVAYLRFATSPDPDFAGQYSRVEFKIIDSLSNSENIIFQPDGSILPRSQVSLTSGSVLIKKYNALVGDINLNGVAMEIADVVYFTNYFLDPVHFPLRGERWVNSDVNQDGMPGTIGDLIVMLRIIRGDMSKISADVSQVSAGYSVRNEAEGLIYALRSDGEVAAGLFTFRVPEGATVSLSPSVQLEGIDAKMSQAGDLVRVLILGSQGESLVGNGEELFRLVGSNDIELISQELVDPLGREVKLSGSAGASQIPQTYELHQNYPNPFNPETMISFDLPQAGETTIEVLNVLGEQVKKIVSGYMGAGRHQVMFDGQGDSGESLPSGVYFYRLQSGDFAATRKMVLLK